MVNRFVSGMWESKTDIGGSVFDLATSYDLLFANKLNDEDIDVPFLYISLQFTFPEISNI